MTRHLPLLLLPALLHAEPITVGEGKLLIEWGWDEPSPAYLRANAARMDTYGFDGTIFHAEPTHDGKAANFAWECWGNKCFEWDDFAANLADLKAANAALTHMTANFLRFNSCPGNVDWLDDAGFAVVAHNASLAGRLAREGGCRGLMFDIEQYNDQLFAYPGQKHKDKTFADYEAIVRQRGKELMQGFCHDYPDITVLLTYGYGITGIGGDRSKASYGLLKNLIDGMLDGCTDQALIVDAYEGAYSFRVMREFASAAGAVLGRFPDFSGNPEAYRRHMRVGFGIWMDNRYGAKDWHPEDFEQNYFLPDEFEHSVFCGLAHSDKYVWIYTEHLNWWENQKLPEAYHQALRNARNPRDVSDESRFWGRQVKGFERSTSGPVAANQAGYSDEDTFGDLKDKWSFVADMPKVWKFRSDGSGVGEAEGWWRPETNLTLWRELSIGKFWDEQGISYLGDAWYRVTFDCPALPAGKPVALWFGAVDELATVWVNGVKVGGHDEPPDLGWDKRFMVDITQAVKAGAVNTVAVKVSNTSLAGGIWKSVKLAVGK
ncbi:MAG: beta galactosidase jelly roll domain-containing protein [Armatimonadetes bacterium]|nr:beta galactosidase jelly roll domain-containing protein [Armatimonadota bacterium]